MKRIIEAFAAVLVTGAFVSGGALAPLVAGGRDPASAP